MEIMSSIINFLVKIFAVSVDLVVKGLDWLLALDKMLSAVSSAFGQFVSNITGGINSSPVNMSIRIYLILVFLVSVFVYDLARKYVKKLNTTGKVALAVILLMSILLPPLGTIALIIFLFLMRKRRVNQEQKERKPRKSFAERRREFFKRTRDRLESLSEKFSE